MYLRTTTRRNADGSTVSYYQLAHNERHATTKRSFPRLIHTFGRTDELVRQELVRLSRSIARVCDLVVVDPLETPDSEAPAQGGLPEDVQLIGTVELGTVTIIEELWE